MAGGGNARSHPRRERDLQVEPARVGVDVENFPCKEDAGGELALHRLGRNVFEFHAARSDDRLFEASQRSENDREIFERVKESAALFPRSVCPFSKGQGSILSSKPTP